MSNPRPEQTYDKPLVFLGLLRFSQIEINRLPDAILDRHLPCPPSGTYWERF